MISAYLSFRINFDSRGIQSREFRNVIITTFTFFFLQLEGNTTDRTARDTLHQVGGETSNLVTETLGLNDGDLVKDLLVDLEVESKTRIVLFNDYTRSLLDSLGSNATLNHPELKTSIHPSIHPSIHSFIHSFIIFTILNDY
jgi:hypothetical protein